MTIKDNIGLRIKAEREEQRMSREVLCLDGDKLTVRQLIRIEKGESLPSLDKLEYIAQRLGKKLADLIAFDEIRVPDDYYERKNRLIKFPTYGDQERLEKKLQLIEEIYKEYFDILPEDELLTLDILEHILGFTNHQDSPKVEEIYEDLFYQVQTKKVFNLNELLVIDYYFFHLYGKKHYDKKLFEKIVKKLLVQEVSLDEAYNIVLLANFMAVAGLKDYANDYKDFLPVIDRAIEVLEQSQQPGYKPNFLCLEAKYYLFHKKDKERAREYYDKAIMFASMLGDSVLEKEIRAEKQRDGLE